MRVALLLLTLVACGPGLKSADMRIGVRDDLTKSLGDVAKLTKLLRAPVVNGGVWFSADAPFGGYKQSGIGREMGVAGFEEYLETKLIAEGAS